MPKKSSMGTPPVPGQDMPFMGMQQQVPGMGMQGQLGSPTPMQMPPGMTQAGNLAMMNQARMAPGAGGGIPLPGGDGLQRPAYNPGGGTADWIQQLMAKQQAMRTAPQKQQQDALAARAAAATALRQSLQPAATPPPMMQAQQARSMPITPGTPQSAAANVMALRGRNNMQQM